MLTDAGKFYNSADNNKYENPDCRPARNRQPEPSPPQVLDRNCLPAVRFRPQRHSDQGIDHLGRDERHAIPAIFPGAHEGYSACHRADDQPA